MSSLDLATQQLVVIARALAKNARLLILDEPTAALTEQESRRLFDRMRVLKARGVAIIFVSHRLAEVFAISDRIVVMRDGRIRGRHRISDVSRKDIVVEMVGDEGADAKLHLANKQTESALQVRNLVVHDIHGRVRVTSLDLDLNERRDCRTVRPARRRLRRGGAGYLRRLDREERRGHLRRRR